MKLACLLLLASLASAQDRSFWTPERKVEVPAFLAATATDAYFTNKNLSAGGTEHNPFTRSFTRTTASRVGYYSALSVATVGGAWLLDRKGHHRMANWLLRIQLGSEAGFAAYSGSH